MATIYCFSSTGNSLYAARGIAQAIGAQVLPMTDGPVTTDDSVVGLVFPTYFWALPRMVERFARGLRVNPGAYVFAVATYGSAHAYEAAGTAGALRRCLRGGLSYAATLRMVDNYVPMYPPAHDDGARERIEGRCGKSSRIFKRGGKANSGAMGRSAARCT